MGKNFVRLIGEFSLLKYQDNAVMYEHKLTLYSTKNDNINEKVEQKSALCWFLYFLDNGMFFF